MCYEVDNHNHMPCSAADVKFFIKLIQHISLIFTQLLWMAFMRAGMPLILQYLFCLREGGPIHVQGRRFRSIYVLESDSSIIWLWLCLATLATR